MAREKQAESPGLGVGGKLGRLRAKLNEPFETGLQLLYGGVQVGQSSTLLLETNILILILQSLMKSGVCPTAFLEQTTWFLLDA